MCIRDSGRTLYFSSRGHPGFGGYDLFKAYRIGTTWQEWSLPENLGLPVNSTRNDRYFYHGRGSNGGYISSDRQVSGFEKIYQINFSLARPTSYLVREADGSVRSVDVEYVAPALRNSRRLRSRHQTKCGITADQRGPGFP